jgi:hypothetical protein
MNPYQAQHRPRIHDLQSIGPRITTHGFCEHEVSMDGLPMAMIRVGQEAPSLVCFDAMFTAHDTKSTRS